MNLPTVSQQNDPSYSRKHTLKILQTSFQIPSRNWENSSVDHILPVSGTSLFWNHCLGIIFFLHHLLRGKVYNRVKRVDENRDREKNYCFPWGGSRQTGGCGHRVWLSELVWLCPDSGWPNTGWAEKGLSTTAMRQPTTFWKRLLAKFSADSLFFWVQNKLMISMKKLKISMKSFQEGVAPKTVQPMKQWLKF